MAQNPLEVSMEVPITGIKLLVSAPTSSLFSPHTGSPNRVTKVLCHQTVPPGQKKFSFYKSAGFMFAKLISTKLLFNDNMHISLQEHGFTNTLIRYMLYAVIMIFLHT